VRQVTKNYSTIIQEAYFTEFLSNKVGDGTPYVTDKFLNADPQIKEMIKSNELEALANELSEGLPSEYTTDYLEKFINSFVERAKENEDFVAVAERVAKARMSTSEMILGVTAIYHYNKHYDIGVGEIIPVPEEKLKECF
jgi:hypothetical protein